MLLYLQEQQEDVDSKIANFDSFPEEIKKVLTKYKDVFDSRIQKSIIVKPAELTVRAGSRPHSCYTCQPTPAHYRTSANKLINLLRDQDIMVYARDMKSKWCAPAHFYGEAKQGAPGPQDCGRLLPSQCMPNTEPGSSFPNRGGDTPVAG